MMEIIDSLLAVRMQLARLHGQPSWSHHKMEGSSLLSPQSAEQLLRNVIAGVKQPAAVEIADLASKTSERLPDAGALPARDAALPSGQEEGEAGGPLMTPRNARHSSRSSHLEAYDSEYLTAKAFDDAFDWSSVGDWFTVGSCVQGEALPACATAVLCAT